MAAPRVIQRRPNEVGFDRIEVNVSKQRKQVLVFIDELGVIAIFEEVSGRLELRLDLPCIATRDQLNDSAKRCMTDLYDEVNVVGHPAVAVNERAVAIDGRRDDLVQPLAVLVLEEDRLLMVASQGDVVEAEWGMNSEPTRHSRSPRCCLRFEM